MSGPPAAPEPPGPSWPLAARRDPHLRPWPVGVAAAITVVWCAVVLVAAVLFALASPPPAGQLDRADPTGLLPEGHWWTLGLGAFYALWSAFGITLAVLAYLRRTWAAVTLAVSAGLVLVLGGSEIRRVLDVPVPLGALVVLLLLVLPTARAWYAAAPPRW